MVIVEGHKPRPSFSVKLRSINRWLRWTGFRVFISYNPRDDSEPRRIGLVWWGWV